MPVSNRFKIGDTVRYVRKSIGDTQSETAKKLDISVVHLSNLENGKALPSPELVERFRDRFGIDLYVLTWCLYGDQSRLPARLRRVTDELTKVWTEELRGRGF